MFLIESIGDTINFKKINNYYIYIKLKNTIILINIV